jgi:hypothetical protein
MSNVKTSVDKGLTGASAMCIQITTLYWLKTITNFQYRYGGSFKSTYKELISQGGFKRLYSGYPPSLLMGGLCRFGDIAIYSHIEDNFDGKTPLDRSIATSVLSSIWRINLMPIDTLDVSLQVEGKNAKKVLINKLKTNGPSVLYYGGLGWTFTNLIGNFTWFYTYRYTSEFSNNSILHNSIQGIGCSLISDVATNPIRVLKTYKQSYPEKISYHDTYTKIRRDHSLMNYLFRGLSSRILFHGLQNAIFLVLWKELEKYKNKNI